MAPVYIIELLQPYAALRSLRSSDSNLQCSLDAGMIADSSTFRPHPGRVIRDLFRLLHAVRHGTESLVYNKYQ